MKTKVVSANYNQKVAQKHKITASMLGQIII